jgi:hypothetical protein
MREPLFHAVRTDASATALDTEPALRSESALDINSASIRARVERSEDRGVLERSEGVRGRIDRVAGDWFQDRISGRHRFGQGGSRRGIGSAHGRFVRRRVERQEPVLETRRETRKRTQNVWGKKGGARRGAGFLIKRVR